MNALSLILAVAPAAAPAPAPAWQDWSSAVFVRAQSEKRLVLLDLGAVWCHWCHVMEETTYRHPRVVELLRDHFVAVRVDQDARPDLANRYEDYGWPATILFDATGRELAKISGYVEPPRMISLLEAFVADPTPGPSAGAGPALVTAATGSLPEAQRQRLTELLVERYDPEHGGWGFAKKFLDWDAVEYSMLRGREGDVASERRARQTLDAQLGLIDPVWGGVYQYSHGGNWANPHFEKLLAFQAENLRVYAQAYALYGEARYLKAARDIHRYLLTFLRDGEGAFYVSQDADLVRGEHAGDYFSLGDAARRARGLPRVDTHLYARENGWAATALLAFHAVTGDALVLAQARAAIRFVLEHRARAGGGFRHDAADPAGPYLGDTLAMGRAFLALYAATGERAWLDHARGAAGFIASRFTREGTPGVLTAASDVLGAPVPQREENLQTARFANLLLHYTGEPRYGALAERAMLFATAPEVASRPQTGGVLLADHELAADPLHLTVVGARDDAVAQALLLEARRDPDGGKRVELWDPADGPLPHSDVVYPRLSRPAAFLCAAGRCSAPAFDVEALRARLRRARDAARADALRGG